ncbi:MAG: hypothetical protein A4E31_01581 [Methanomassiliicoccales archaeon PtaU1.Bin030]|jgi:hypothetical protein|nr:MAG: hypothetical protein A4E31_01581 [Methanomassiliicoccales archaeon PtaU1.Bin030]
MWKVLGVETILINADAVWVDRLMSLSQRRKDAPRFRDLLGRADVRYYFDTIREVHMFRLQLPPEVTLEELEFMKEFIMRLYKAAKVPVVEFDGQAQLSSVVLSSDEEEDTYRMKRDSWSRKKAEKK